MLIRTYRTEFQNFTRNDHSLIVKQNYNDLKNTYTILAKQKGDLCQRVENFILSDNFLDKVRLALESKDLKGNYKTNLTN